MIARVWRTGVKQGRFEDYDRFAHEHSLPMFRKQRGLLGVLFLRESAGRAAVLTLWEDERAVEELETSPLYQQTVEDILDGGFLTEEQSVEVFEVHGGDVRSNELATASGIE